MRSARRLAASAALAAATLAAAPVPVQDDVPRIDARAGGRPTLIVDGAPFLMLGGQVNNSSNHISALPQVWRTIAAMNANTLEMPVAWGQIEPIEGAFDFAFVDTLLDQARAHGVRLVLLWFGTWKNGGSGYTPEWVKTDLTRFPRKLDDKGRPQFALSPFARTTLNADKAAFVALMRHLAARDAQNTVIMMQVENEAGAFGLARDRLPMADRLFDGPVPGALAARLQRPAGTWRQTFGPLADQAFMSWHTARYIEEIAAAGKTIKPLPMYANAALSDPLAATVDPRWVSSGSPDWNMIDIWKVAAPHLDLVAPDIYTRDWRQVEAHLRAYGRADNALMVPEIGNAADYGRFFWAALGHGAIGFAPFGMDATGYVNYPLGAKALDADTIAAFGRPYALMGPTQRGWAALSARVAAIWGVAKGADGADQSRVFGEWRVTAQFDRWMIGDESWTFVKADPAPSAGRAVGGAAVLQTAPDIFVVAGSDIRLRFARAVPGKDEQWQYLSVEEGTLDERGNWVAGRPWNGDQIDYGVNLPASPVMLRVRLGRLS